MKRNSDNEMEQIRRGLEDFLQKELQGTEMKATGDIYKGQYMKDAEDIYEESYMNEYDEDSEEEYDGDYETYYAEDWDAKERRSSGMRGQTQVRGQSSSQTRRRTQGRGQSSETGGRSQGRGQSSNQAYGVQKEMISQKTTEKKMRKETNKSNVKNKQKKRKKSKFKKFLVTLLIITLLLGGGLYYLVGVVYAKLNYEPIDTLVREPMKEEGVVNILLIGNDSRENGADGRSDAMILLSISNNTKKIYMTSLLRDMYVDIPGHDGNRLNAAYSYGGPELLMETIEKNFGITVNRYVRVNFEAFANLVDAVGGIELDLSQKEIEYVNGYLVEYNMLFDRPQGTDNMDATSGGVVHLNGPQALAYTRNRDMGMDFGRTERQRKVLAEVIRKLPKALISNPKEILNGILPNLTTNLTKNECLRLSLMAGKFVTYEIQQDSIPKEGTYENVSIRGMSVLEVDFETNRKYLQENIYGQED